MEKESSKYDPWLLEVFLKLFSKFNPAIKEKILT